MHRLSFIINEIYNKYLPKAQDGNITLNIDLSDPTKEIAEVDKITEAIEEYLNSAFERTGDNGEIRINVDKDAITISDTGTILSKPICSLLSGDRITINSRVGFGTTVHISLTPKPTVGSTPNTPETVITESTIEEIRIEAPASNKNTEAQPKAKTSSRKTSSRDQRKLNAAAKKADKELQKIAKKASKKSQKSASARSTKKPTKTHKKVIELS